MVLKAVLKSISANATWHSSKSSEAPQFDMCATLSPLSAIWGNMQYAIPFVLMRTVEKGCKNCFIARHKCRQRSLWPVHNFICHNTCIYTIVYIYIYIRSPVPPQFAASSSSAKEQSSGAALLWSFNSPQFSHLAKCEYYGVIASTHQLLPISGWGLKRPLRANCQNHTHSPQYPAPPASQLIPTAHLILPRGGQDESDPMPPGPAPS